MDINKTTVSSAPENIPANYETIDHKTLRQLGIKNTKIIDRIILFFSEKKKEQRDAFYINIGKTICEKDNIKRLTEVDQNISNIFQKNFSHLPSNPRFGLKLKAGQEKDEAERLLLLSKLNQNKEFLKFTEEQKINLNSLSLEQLNDLKIKFDISSFPEEVKNILIKLRENDSDAAKELESHLMKDENFRNQVVEFKLENKDTDALIIFLQELKSENNRNGAVMQIKQYFGIPIANEWLTMESNNQINLETWNDPKTNRIEYFAEAYQKKLNNPLISTEIILRCLPDNLDRIIEINKFSEARQKEGKMPLEPAIFQQFLKDVPIPLIAKNYKQINEFYDFYKKESEDNKESLSSLIEELNNSEVLMQDLQNHLPELQELIEFGIKFTKNPGYPSGVIGRAMATVITDFNDLKKSIDKSTIYGWNISDKFKEAFQQEAFKTFIKDAGGLDFGETQLLSNYYREIKIPVTKGDIAWAREIGTFIKQKMKEGFTFTDINSAIQKNLIFKPGSNKQVISTLPSALQKIGESLHKPQIDPEKVFQTILEHPIKLLGSFLDSFITRLISKKDQKNAGTIRDGFELLDSHNKDIKAVINIRRFLKVNSGLIKLLLPVLLTDADKAAQNLILSASKTIEANLKIPPEEGELKQMKDLVSWVMDQARNLKINPSASLFQRLPTSKEDHKELRSNLEKIKYLGLLDSFLGRKIIERVVLRSTGFKSQLPLELQGKVGKMVTSLASTLVAALPTIIKNFSVDNYLDFLIQVGIFSDGKLSEADFKLKIWEILQVLVKDVSKLEGAIPEVFETIRKLGIEG